MDGQVNLQDFGVLEANCSTGAHWYQGDFNYNGTVNLQDFGLLKATYGSTPIGAEAAVPEPSVLVLLGTGVAGLVSLVACGRWRKRRRA